MGKKGLIWWVVGWVMVGFLAGPAALAQRFQLSGQVLDQQSRQPIEYANVSVWANDSVLVAGTVTDGQGKFSFRDLAANFAQVRVQFVGYQSVRLRPTLPAAGQAVVLPPILLASAQTVLGEVEVKAEKPVAAVQIDKQVYDVKQFQNAANGTGLDLLQRLPSVTVNAEGAIALRGSPGFILLIDGKPTTRAPADVLAQLPANAIERVEVVTSPSAKYDADGKAGIINIITQPQAASGASLSGNVMLGGLDPLRFGGDLTATYQTKRWSIYGAADYRRFDINGYRYGDVRTLLGDTLTYLPSEGIRNYRDYQYGLRAGGSFSPSPRHVLNWAGYLGEKQTDRTANLYYDDYRRVAPGQGLFDRLPGPPFRQFFNQNLFVRSGRFRTANVDYTLTLPNRSRLTLLGLYEYSVLGGPLNNFDTWQDNGQPLLHERSDERSPLTAWRAQADYVLPLSAATKMEVGYQFRHVRHDGDFTFDRRDLATNQWRPDPEFTDAMQLRQAIHAGYWQLSHQKTKFSYNLGLRAEYMDRVLTHTLGRQPFTLAQLNLFPSVQALWQLGGNQSLRAGYNRRIERPTTKLMSPFQNHRHAETIELGDPNLRPEIADVVELSYSKGWKLVTLNATGYVNYLRDKVFRVNDIYSRTILFRTYTNAGNSTSAGVELATELRLARWWKFYASGNFYQFRVQGVVNGLAVDQTSFNFNVNGNTTVDLSPRLRLQWDLSYLSRTVTSQGLDSELLLANASLRYTLWRSRATLGLQLQNMFNTNIQTITTEQFNFYTATDYRKWDRVLQLSLGFRLNDSGKKAKTIKTDYGEKDY
jgi:outer membrane receptor protein involved in Fe transport